MYWLLKETDWLRVNLMPQVKIEPEPKRRWQFRKYGDDVLISWRVNPCGLACKCRECRKDDERWFGWRIPARTVKIYGSTINFKEGCNLYRAKILKDIVKAQKSKAIPRYEGGKVIAPAYYNCTPELSIDLLVDGKPLISFNGDYKHGAIKEAFKPYQANIRQMKRLIK